MSIKRILAVACVLSALLGLVACNTVQGFGQDLEAGGHALTKAAKKDS